MRARHPIAIACAAWALAFAPLAAHAAAQPVETSVSAETVMRGEPIALRIRLRGVAGASEPDLSPLARDFELLDVQRSQRTSIVNGVRDASIDWLVELLPRRSGTLEIPALAVGGDATEPVSIEVSASGAAPTAREPEASAADAAADAAPVRLEVHADRTQPYEHERVLLRVELYASGDVTDGALSAPEIPGTLIQPIGEDRRIEKQIDGRLYHGIERSYTLLPEASGELEIPPIRFEGRMRMPRPAARARGPRGFFGQAFFDDFFAQAPLGDALLEDFFGMGSRPIVVESEPLALNVRPRPATAAGAWWLPAREVALSEHWDPAAPSIRVGEPLTRRIELRADGASPAQLPPLATPDVAGLKQYAEAPKSSESARGALRTDQTTLIPTQPGEITLPAVEVAWWDTQADAPRTAVLPARTVAVLPAVGGGGAPAGAQAAQPAAASSATTPGAAITPAPAAAPSLSDPRLLAAALAFALGAASLLGVVFLLVRRRGPGASAHVPTTTRSAERALRRACVRNDPAAAESALRALGQTLMPHTHSWQGTRWAEGLGSPELLEAIARLQALRYSNPGEAWDGAGLWQAWRQARKTRRRQARRPKRARQGLPPLYPAEAPPRG
jgi:hypothetical protein